MQLNDKSRNLVTASELGGLLASSLEVVKPYLLLKNDKIKVLKKNVEWLYEKLWENHELIGLILLFSSDDSVKKTIATLLAETTQLVVRNRLPTTVLENYE